MPNVSGKHLMMAIRAVDAKILELERELDARPAEVDDQGELELLHLSYTNTAEALRRAYEEALLTVTNLPPYATLVSGD